MRKVLILAALPVMAGCMPEIVMYEVPIESPIVSKPASVRPGTERVMSVDKLYAWCDGNYLRIWADVTANSGGWREPRLNPLPSDDGRLTFEAVAMPPRGSASQALLGMRIEYDDAAPAGIQRVRVMSQTNQMETEITLGPCS